MESWTLEVEAKGSLSFGRPGLAVRARISSPGKRGLQCVHLLSEGIVYCCVYFSASHLGEGALSFIVEQD